VQFLLGPLAHLGLAMLRDDDRRRVDDQ